MSTIFVRRIVLIYTLKEEEGRYNLYTQTLPRGGDELIVDSNKRLEDSSL